LALVVLVACAGGDELGSDLERLELEQLDCRPVCAIDCINAWNVRACCHVPPECAIDRADDDEPEPSSP
jgi:hypothetical protein